MGRRCLLSRAHWLSAVVLPNPAGADTSTNPEASASVSRSIRRGRATRPGRGRGRNSLVASSGVSVSTFHAPAQKSSSRMDDGRCRSHIITWRVPGAKQRFRGPQSFRGSPIPIPSSETAVTGAPGYTLVRYGV
jgi:hypothetical protein